MADSLKPTPEEVGSPEQRSNRGPTAGARNLIQLAGVTVALAAICAIGLLDRSVRADPFTGSPGLWQWFSKPQPDPRLTIIPVLPMGPAGVLSWRPNSTQWIAEKSISQPASSAPRSAAEAFSIGSAHAAEPVPSNKVRPKPGGLELPDINKDKADPPRFSPLPPFNVQQFPQPSLNVQQVRPSETLKEAPKEAPRPPATTLVPNPATEARFSQLPSRTPLPPDAYWAGCDISGRYCSSVQGSEYLLSVNGGEKWTSDFRRSNESPPLLVLEGQRNLVFSDVGPTGQLPTGNSASPDLIDFQLPFALAEYGIGNQARGFRSSTMDNAIDRGAREYLQLTGSAGRLNFFGVLPPRSSDASDPGDSSYRMFVLFSNGRALRVVLKPTAGIPGQIRHETAFIDVQTRASLRSLHFQPDQRIGWMSSGWNDGNEEGIYPAIFETTNGGADWERLSYRARPAPWVLYMAMPALIFAFFATGAAWRDSRGENSREGIADIGTSDTPIGWNDRDVLGLKPLALSLSRFIRNTNTAPPLTIAVTGAWGTGKSSLMNLVAEDLRGRGADPVWFNAWHHQKEENILAALLENIRAQAIPSAWRFSGLAFRFRLLASRIGANVFPLLLSIAILVTLATTFDWRALADNVIGWSNLQSVDIHKWFNQVAGVGFSALLVLIIKVYGTLNLKPSELMATLRNNAKLADFSAQLSFRYKFAIEFNAAAQALRTSTNPGLVIFIDDLDRCGPENLMAVLESINFLTTAGPCFILLGMDEPKIIEIVAQQYGGDRERARQYLKKLINLTVPVPEINEANSIDLSSGADPALAAASPWPKRIRGALRNIPDACVPALALIAAIWFLASWLPPITPQDKQPGQSSQQQTTGPAPAADDAGQGATPGPARDNTLVKQTRIPAVTVDQLLRQVEIQPYLGVALAILIIVLLIARRVTTLREDKVEDSKDFRNALAIWHPAVFAADPTPRGVKRHQNRLRLQAMRLRPLHEKPDLLDSWFSAKANSEDSDKTKSPDISEPKLVALGGIAALLEDIPSWSIQDNQSTAPPDGQATQNLSAIITRCRSNFKATFPGDWPPTQSDIDAFRNLRQSL